MRHMAIRLRVMPLALVLGLGIGTFAQADTGSALSGPLSGRDLRMQTRTAWDYQPGQGPHRTERRDYIRSEDITAIEKPTSPPRPDVTPGDWRKAPTAESQLPIEPFSAEPRTEDAVELGVQGSYYHYHEATPPEMKTQGGMYGVVASYTDAFGEKWFGRVEGRFIGGRPRTKGFNQDKNVPSYVGEARATIGWDLLRGHFGISPYVGLGYRYAQSDMYRFDGEATTGFTRIGHYLFAPVGIQPRVTLLNGAHLVLTAEFDPLLYGWQQNQLNDISSAWPKELTTRQKKGYGLRGEVSYQTARWTMGPFVNYWNINESEEDCGQGTGAGALDVCSTDPHNHTVEYGLNVRYRFH